MQVLQLKQNQVDYESMKLENSRIKGDLDDMNVELLELAKLKQIVEKNLEEALESLQHEREQKHAYKKELDQRVTSESIFNLQSLASLGLGLDISRRSDGGHAADEQDVNENAALKRLEADFSRSPADNQLNNATAFGAARVGDRDNAAGASPVGDLFSEIHVNEVRKLEQLLETTTNEKGDLEALLATTQESLQAARRDIEEQREKIAQMKAHISSLSAMTAGGHDVTSDLEAMDLNDEDAVDSSLDPEILAMRKSIRQKDLSYAAALKQISELQEQIKNLQSTVSFFMYIVYSCNIQGFVHYFVTVCLRCLSCIAK